MKSIPRAKAVVLFLSLRAEFYVHAHSFVQETESEVGEN